MKMVRKEDELPIIHNSPDSPAAEGHTEEGMMDSTSSEDTDNVLTVENCSCVATIYNNEGLSMQKNDRSSAGCCRRGCSNTSSATIILSSSQTTNNYKLLASKGKQTKRNRRGGNGESRVEELKSSADDETGISNHSVDKSWRMLSNLNIFNLGRDKGRGESSSSGEKSDSVSETMLTTENGPTKDKKKDLGPENNHNWNWNSTLYFLLVVSLKILLLLSVLLLLTTLLWFHIRLTALELENQELRMKKHGRDSQSELEEREQLPPSFTGWDINEGGNGRVVSTSKSATAAAPIPPGTSLYDDRLSGQGRQRVKRRVDGQTQQQQQRPRLNPNLSGYNVEFINPKTREEVEKAGGGSTFDHTAGSSSQHQESSNANTVPDDDWVWLTSYSRIPLNAIQEFCSATKEYCPSFPGPPGPSGPSGRSGPKGDKGDLGDPGSRGPQGPPGFPGLKGPRGEPGLPGADGRDGLPGEPGLDGIPGRSGLDGIPGMDGIPGFDGRPGVNGTNGSDGNPGPSGPPGLPGHRGLPGPQGRQGLGGKDGVAGIPGVNIWLYNDTTSQRLLIPPSIEGGETKARAVVVNERENVRLSCSAVGVPRPVVKWKREDGSPIRLGAWKSSGIEGPTFNLTNINREHMGEYMCIADNGITPWQKRTFLVEVHFPPMIRIMQNQIGVSLGSVAMFDCFIEAYPTAVTYWERSDGRVLENGDKYQIGAKESNIYKIHMMLNVTRVSTHDMGRYHCIAKNELGITKGDFTVYEVDPSMVTPPPKIVGGKGVAIYGQVQPEHVDLDDLCPSPPPCPDCPPRIETGKCRSGGFALLDMVGWEIYPLGNLTAPSPTNRTQDCILSAVGKPVFNRYSSHPAGCWMKDPVGTGHAAEKYWVTRLDDTNHLYEYFNKTQFAMHQSTRNYTLPFPFRGNFHAVYNGSLFYITESKEGHPKIVRLDLFTGKSSGDLELPYASFSAGYLYSSEHSWVDLATDENGIWAIHSLVGSNNTAVVKIHADQDGMQILYGWNVTISHTYAGDMFIICGVLYAVDSATDRDTKIRLALDLYRRTLLKVDLSFSNPFRHTSMVSYNPRTRELFTWDKGNQLIYPVKYTDIGYDRDDKEKSNDEAFFGLPPVTYSPPSSMNNPINHHR